MLKKCIATYVSLLMVLIPFSTVLAAGGNNKPVLDEKTLIGKLTANSPFDMPALKKIQALNAQAVQQSAQELLDLLESNDGAVSLLLDEARAIKPAADIKQMIRDNVLKLAAATDPVVPGCLTPYVFASLEFWAVAPVSFIYFMDNLIYNSKYPACGNMYGEWWLASLFTSLAIYQTYYICAENSKAVPDPAIIANYESDRTTMRLLAALFYGFYAYTVSVGNCPNSLFNISGNNNKK